MARLALRCAKPLTALTFLEEAVKQHHPRHRLCMADIQSTPLTSACMDAYLAIQEPDSIHAATSTASPMSRLQRVLLDGRWADALTTADALGDTALRQTCLQHLGCHALAAQCVGPDGEAAMETAWRMGQWGGLGQAVTSTTEASSGALVHAVMLEGRLLTDAYPMSLHTGFHGSLTAALRAFVQGDLAMLNEARGKALSSVAMQLHTQLPEGHAPFNAAVVQLQMACAVGCVSAFQRRCAFQPQGGVDVAWH